VPVWDDVPPNGDGTGGTTRPPKKAQIVSKKKKKVPSYEVPISPPPRISVARRASAPTLTPRSPRHRPMPRPRKFSGGLSITVHESMSVTTPNPPHRESAVIRGGAPPRGLESPEGPFDLTTNSGPSSSPGSAEGGTNSDHRCHSRSKFAGCTAIVWPKIHPASGQSRASAIVHDQ